MSKRPRPDDAAPAPPAAPPAPPSSSSSSSAAHPPTLAQQGSTLLSLLERQPRGMTQREITGAMGVGAAQLLPILQSLMNSKRVETYTIQRQSSATAAAAASAAAAAAAANPKSPQLRAAALAAAAAASASLEPAEVLYKAVAAEQAQRLIDLSAEDQMVLQIIERSGGEGVWVRTIKNQSRLQQAAVVKILKRLEARRLIKAVKSVVYKWRKMYMLYDVQPAKQVTGGPWYTDQQLDTAFIHHLSQAVQRVLQARGGGPCSADEVAAAIKRLGISQVELKPKDIRAVLDSLVFDGICDYEHGAERRARALKRHSRSLFPQSGALLKLGYDDEALDVGLFEQTAEELEAEAVAAEGGGGGGGGGARASAASAPKSRLITLRRGGAAESMIGAGAGLTRRARLSAVTSIKYFGVDDDPSSDEGEAAAASAAAAAAASASAATAAAAAAAAAVAAGASSDDDDGDGGGGRKGKGKAALSARARAKAAAVKKTAARNRTFDGSSSSGGEANDAAGAAAASSSGSSDDGSDDSDTGSSDEESDDDSDAAGGAGAARESKRDRRKRRRKARRGEDSDDEDEDEDEDESDDDDAGAGAGGAGGAGTDESAGGRRYVLVRKGGGADLVSGVPCGVCPVANFCEEGGVISPRSCVYMSQWLEF